MNSPWLPAVALKTPVVLKPGRDDPWTPLRIVRALLAAGAPPAAFGYYPTDHEGADAIAQVCERALLFGNEETVKRHASNSAVQVHGPGYSKVLIGEDEIECWPEFFDVLVRSILDNGGRRVDAFGRAFLLPAVVRCPSFDHPLANREFLFPYASMVEVPQAEMPDQIGPSLVVSAITRDADWIAELLASRDIAGLNVGRLPTSHIEWDQPHEGNLFELLYRRRALQWADVDVPQRSRERNSWPREMAQRPTA